MRIFRNFLFIWLVSYCAQNYAQEKSLADVNFKRSFISFDESVEVGGLIHYPSQDSLYVQKLVGKLIQSAHAISAEDWLDEDEGIFRFYHSFLLLSLQVPMHESSLIHITNRDPKENCVFSNDILGGGHEDSYYINAEMNKAREVIKKIVAKLAMTYDPEDDPAKFYFNQCRKGIASITNECKKLNTHRIRLSNTKFLTKNIKIFYDAYQREGVFVTCSELAHLSRVNQILFSNDYADIGLMMFNAKSHGEFFFTEQFKNTDKVIDYGLSFLYEGFNKIAYYASGGILENIRYFSSLSCYDDFSESSFESKLDLLRGSWAGKYNSGKVRRSCRFARTDKGYADTIGGRNDQNYLMNLARLFRPYTEEVSYQKYFAPVLAQAKKTRTPIRKSLYDIYLPVDSLELAVLNELRDNIFHNTQKNYYLNQLLNRDYSGDDIVQEYVKEKPFKKVKVNKVDVVQNNLEFISYRGQSIYENEETEELVAVLGQIQDKLVLGAGEEFPAKQNLVLTDIIEGRDVPLYIAGKKEACLSSSDLQTKVVKVIKVSQEGDFIQVKIPDFNLDSTVELNECMNSSTFLVNKDHLKSLWQKPVLYLTKLKMAVNLRDVPGSQNSRVVKLLPPGVIQVTSEQVRSANGKDYLWLEVMDEKGLLYWFYAGRVNSDQKVEALDEI